MTPTIGNNSSFQQYSTTSGLGQQPVQQSKNSPHADSNQPIMNSLGKITADEGRMLLANASAVADRVTPIRKPTVIVAAFSGKSLPPLQLQQPLPSPHVPLQKPQPRSLQHQPQFPSNRSTLDTSSVSASATTASAASAFTNTGSRKTAVIFSEQLVSNTFTHLREFPTGLDMKEAEEIEILLQEIEASSGGLNESQKKKCKELVKRFPVFLQHFYEKLGKSPPLFTIPVVSNALTPEEAWMAQDESRRIQDSLIRRCKSDARYINAMAERIIDNDLKGFITQMRKYLENPIDWMLAVRNDSKSNPAAQGGSGGNLVAPKGPGSSASSTTGSVAGSRVLGVASNASVLSVGSRQSHTSASFQGEGEDS